MFLSCVVLAGSTFGGDARCSVLCDLRAPSCLRLHQERVCLSRGGRWQGRRYPAASRCALVLIRFDFCWGCSVARIRPAGHLSPPSCSIRGPEWFWRLSCLRVCLTYTEFCIVRVSMYLKFASLSLFVRRLVAACFRRFGFASTLASAFLVGFGVQRLKMCRVLLLVFVCWLGGVRMLDSLF